MALIFGLGSSTFRFETQAEVDAFTEALCDAMEKGRCFQAPDINGDTWTMLPNGQTFTPVLDISG